MAISPKPLIVGRQNWCQNARKNRFPIRDVEQPILYQFQKKVISTKLNLPSQRRIIEWHMLPSSAAYNVQLKTFRLFSALNRSIRLLIIACLNTPTSATHTHA